MLKTLKKARYVSEWWLWCRVVLKDSVLLWSNHKVFGPGLGPS